MTPRGTEVGGTAAASGRVATRDDGPGTAKDGVGGTECAAVAAWRDIAGLGAFRHLSAAVAASRPRQAGHGTRSQTGGSTVLASP